MTSRRQEKFNSLLEQLTSSFIAKEIRNALITITRVESSKDLKNAKIFISIFPEDKEVEIFRILKSKIGELRHYIGSRIKSKFLPRLEIEISEEEKAQKRIDELLKK